MCIRDSIDSMHAIYVYIGVVWAVNVGIYGIHEVYALYYALHPYLHPTPSPQLRTALQTALRLDAFALSAAMNACDRGGPWRWGLELQRALEERHLEVQGCRKGVQNRVRLRGDE